MKWSQLTFEQKSDILHGGGLPLLIFVLGVGSLIAGKGTTPSDLLSLATFLVMGVWFGFMWGRS